MSLPKRDGINDRYLSLIHILLPGACRFNPTVAPCVALCALSWGDEQPYPCRTVGGFLRALCGYFKEADKWTVPAVPPNAPWNEVDRGVENSAG